MSQCAVKRKVNLLLHFGRPSSGYNDTRETASKRNLFSSALKDRSMGLGNRVTLVTRDFRSKRPMTPARLNDFGFRTSLQPGQIGRCEHRWKRLFEVALVDTDQISFETCTTTDTAN
ncbi:hypothetical protein PUN28_013546 [Cardiocondyla obscurior]|uniref:Uncharacterized protein n=1 Tax=Cardiocondyla obscurior TaxID=286306 RepID=A0AAW2F4D9_9HYME